VSNTFILTWNPKLWPWPAAEFDRAVQRTEAGESSPDQWSVGARSKGIAIGDRAFLLRQQSDRGIIASGRFTSEVYRDVHWDDSERDTTYAKLAWDAIVYTEQRLSTENLKLRLPSITWDRLQGSGVKAPAEAADELEAIWAEHLDRVPVANPDEPKDRDVHKEGGLTKVVANRYERDRNARRKCIEHWGTDCSVCGFNFGATYGGLGVGFVHVHHLRELSAIGEEYIVDPVSDLRPVCANCHAMLHRRRPALAIATLKKKLSQ
jgi:5-methylcytosine-specific restriction enzyme A